MSQQLNDQERERRESLTQLRELGIDPFPAALYPVNNTSVEIKASFKDEEPMEDICIAGRLMSRRIMGKASFAEVMDHAGRIQLYFNRDEICTGEDKSMYNIVFKKSLDIGDFIGVKGHVFRTKVGEVSVHVKEFTVLSKALRPLPVVKTDADGNVHDGFADKEQRYRMRYVDLVVNPEVKETFLKRTKIINLRFLKNIGKNI